MAGAILKATYIFAGLLLLRLANQSAWAGPPYVTDDPEPVELKHWEFYAASQTAHDDSGWTGTAPHVEVNYGAAPNLQLHVIAPFAFSKPTGSPFQEGYGDTEVGAKYRFVEESDSRPQIGEFAMIELPTGDNSRGLGEGHLQVFLPIWIQKKLGQWLTYGGGGYWFEPSTKVNWWFTGFMLQRQMRDDLAIGIEFYHTTAKRADAPRETRINVGAVYDISDLHHVLLSSGRGLEGPNLFQSYLAYQLTIGPK